MPFFREQYPPEKGVKFGSHHFEPFPSEQFAREQPAKVPKVLGKRYVAPATHKTLKFQPPPAQSSHLLLFPQFQRIRLSCSCHLGTDSLLGTRAYHSGGTVSARSGTETKAEPLTARVVRPAWAPGEGGIEGKATGPFVRAGDRRRAAC